MLDEPYLFRPEQWEVLAGVLADAGVIGLDTEFHGVDLEEQHPIGRSRIHVWSVAVRTDRRSPLGFHRARGWCLPATALEHPALRRVLEDPRVKKAVHNQGVDDHALFNHGVRLRGAINTLAYLRWKRPELINTPGRFALKPTMVALLRREPVCTYKELVTYQEKEFRSTFRKVKRSECICGTEGCRLRKGHPKAKTVDVVETVHEKWVDREYPLELIIPGHPRWDLLVRYAIDDAIAALEILELCDETDDPAPFPYGGERPLFNQAVETRVVEMERVGIPIDVPYAAGMVVRANEDEEKELRFLRRWYAVNVDPERPPEEVDKVWSSVPQKVELFDSLGFPRSPIWKKGRVKRGEVKMDQDAMAWIAKNHPPARQLCERLLRLQRIRSGRKYLEKLAASGGMVHPTCGPSGDDDGRAGAVTGRLGVKVELEAQQLPSVKEKDLYKIRRAIVANASGSLQA